MSSGHGQPHAALDASDRDRRQGVDAAVDLALDGGLLLEADDPVAVALDAAERDGVDVAPDADRGHRPEARVRIEQPADVRARDEVAVHQQDRLGRRLGQQAERAGGAERLVLAQVVDAGAEPRSVLEVILDDVAQVVHRDRDAGDARPHEVQDRPLEDRPAGDAQHRLGDGLGQRPQPDALAAGHDHGVGRALDRDEERVQQVEPDRPAVAIEDRDRADPPGPHELEDLGPALARSDRHEVAVQERVDEVVQGRPGQQGPAQVAIGDDPDQPAVAVDAQGDLVRAGVEGLHGIADRAVGRDDAGLEAVGHARTPERGRRGEWPGRAADDRDARRDVGDDHGAHADRRAIADRDVVADQGAHADGDVGADARAAPDDRARPDVDEGADPDVVLDDGARVDDAVRPDARARR